MNEQEFLAELETLQPRAISAELKQRIADRLPKTEASAARRSKFRSRRVAAFCVAAAVLAASVALAVRIRSGGEQLPARLLADPLVHAPVAGIGDERLPSVWAYQQAARRSPAALDALLDKHSTNRPASELAHWHVFTRSTDRVPAFGEL